MSDSVRRPGTLVVGLLGGIGSGKSEVAHILAEGVGRVVSGDHLGHEALKQPEIRDAVVERWGAQVLGPNGEIARPKLAAVVFEEPAQRRRLEELVHPWIKEAIAREVGKARADAVPLVVLDAAVLLEAGWEGGVDLLLYVETPRDVRLRRIAATRGWTEEEVSVREMAQLPLEEKARRAHATVSNAGGLDDLRSRLAGLRDQWGLSFPKKAPESGRSA